MAVAKGSVSLSSADRQRATSGLLVEKQLPEENMNHGNRCFNQFPTDTYLDFVPDVLNLTVKIYFFSNPQIACHCIIYSCIKYDF